MSEVTIIEYRAVIEFLMRVGISQNFKERLGGEYGGNAPLHFP